MNCPKCGNKLTCGCSVCKVNFPDEKDTQMIISNLSEDNNIWDESCPKCGLTMSVHEWADVEYQQYSSKDNV